MSADIHIDDLGSPRLSEAQLAALKWGEGAQVDFSEESILAVARAKTGLADFGPDDFRERLALLCNEWGGDRGITGFHRTVLHGYLTRYASNRLLIQDVWKKHPEIFDEQIEAPLIVAGLPRSGTTHLVNLLAADTRFHALPLWEAYEPVPLPGDVVSNDCTDPRYQRCADAWSGMQAVTPLLAAMHPMQPEHIHEELELMGPDFASYQFEWLSLSPHWRDHYLRTDQTPHYEYTRDVLKLLQWRRGGERRRWVLKCPQHLEQLPVLKKVFPDATVVMTHRDPVAVIQSAVTLQAYNQRMNRREITQSYLIRYWKQRIEVLLQSCIRDRDIWPVEQSMDVLFHEFMADDIATIEKIYALAGLELTVTARSQMDHYLELHPRGKEGRIIYDLKKDFGVDPADLREHFKFYFNRYAIKAETR